MAWVRIARAADVERERVLGVEAGGEEIAICRVDGTVHAIGNICTHAQARLSDGVLDGDCIECPIHQALFNVTTGEAVAGPADAPVKTFPCRLEGGEVWVEI